MNDIFISYAHIDNLPLVEKEEGWVSCFHRTLTVRLSQIMGKQVTIWRDRKLQGNDIFNATLIDELTSSSLLISILSPRYASSEWCQKELGEFIRHWEHSGGLSVGNKTRVFKVIKTPLEIGQQPASIQNLLGYDFFKTDQDSGRVRELCQLTGQKTDPLYWMRVDDIAYDISQFLKENAALKPQTVVATNTYANTKSTTASKNVFLSLTTSDLKEKWNILKRELQQHDYEIYPSQSIPLIQPETENFIADELNKCELSVHMIGEQYGIVPEGTNNSLIEIQNQQASQLTQKKALQRIIWLPESKQISDNRQKTFIQNLQENESAYRGADVLRTSLEDLKRAIFQKLNPKPAAPPHPPSNKSAILIYIICDGKDIDHTSELEDYLFGLGFEVILPIFEGDEADVREDHQENLLHCDSVLFYYGRSNELWLRAKIRELTKISGYGREKPFLSKGILLAEPFTERKERFRSHDIVVMKSRGTDYGQILKPFLAISKENNNSDEASLE